MNIGKKRLVIHPVGYFLFAAVIGGIAAPIVIRSTVVKTEAINSGIYPDTWKFETVRQAQATVAGASQKQTSQYHLNMDTGITVTIETTDGPSDCVFLRNGFNFDAIKDRKDLIVSFAAKSDTSSPIFFAMREESTVRWSQQLTLTPDWRTYSVPVSFQNFTGSHAIMAIHLGFKPGTISIKEVKLAAAQN
jgi:hypothetical protein